MNHKESYRHCENHRNHCQPYKKPMIKAIEHTNSPKIANPRDRELPIPNGSGNAVDNSWKVAPFLYTMVH